MFRPIPTPFSAAGMLRWFPRLALLATSALLVAGCEGGSPTAPPAAPMCTGSPASTSAAPAPRPSLEAAFAAAARDFGVPAELLKAVAFVETRLQMVEGSPEMGQEAAYGVMALREGVLDRAASLAGVSVHEARYAPAANVRAAAALLGAYADELEVDRGDVGAWAPAVARYSGISLAAGRASYVHDDVYAVLREGYRLPAASLAPRSARPDYPRPSLSRSALDAAEHPGARWIASPNFNQRPAQRAAIIIVHTCEGAYTGCWSWLANPSSGVSAHYVVREDGAEITQLVHERERAWHIGARYDCTLNGGHGCELNGQQSNDFTIGIEHAGYARQTMWPAEQIEASARLVCGITRRHGIPRDRIHIVAHGQLQPHNRTDPGPNWPWADYLERINRNCGDAAVEPLVIDTDNSRNDRRLGYFEAGSSWIPSTAAAGYFGSGYLFAMAHASPDPAAFHFFLAQPGTRTVEAWWTEAPDRSTRAPFLVSTAEGRELAMVLANQQRQGGRWNVLGTWSFPAGWNRIQLLRQAEPGCVVVADAVRLR